MTTVPDQKLLSDPSIPTIMLAEQRWPIPRLSLKANAIVVPLLIKAARGFTSESITDMATSCFWAVERGHKTLTREEFDEMPIGVTELAEAIDVISRQTGLVKPAKGANGVAVPLVQGETNSPIGAP
jgi:hypothetical protein